MGIKYKPYRARSTVNKLKHTDSWFWNETGHRGHGWRLRCLPTAWGQV